MLRIAICDDEKLQLDHTAGLVKAALDGSPTELRRFTSAEGLVQALNGDPYLPDIALLDIELGGLDGIRLAETLNRLRPDCCIIFITGYLRYAPDVYFTEHIWFILKSEIESRIGPALRKAIAFIEARNDSGSKYITVKSAGRVTVLPLSEVVYLERRGRKTLVVTDDKVCETYSTPAELLSGLGDGCFIRCHQSFYGIAKRIRCLEKTGFVIDNGMRIPISRSYFASASEAFFKELRKP